MTVKTDSFEAVYNGSPMGEEKLIITDGSLASNQRFDYDNYNYDGFIHVGEYQNKVGVKIVDGNGNDVTHCYEVTSKYGTITITPFKITVSSAGNSKVYDGEKLLLPEIDVVYQGELPTTLTRFDVDSFKGEMIKPETRKHISGYILTDTNSKESNNYIVEITNHGTLKITKRQITIITESKTWEYDGEVHSTEGKYSIGGDGIAATDNFRVENYIKIDEVWQSGAENKLYYSISCVNDYDYWECYEVTEQFGTLTVTPRRITVTSASASKTYDGTPLTVRSATATREADSGFALVDEHYIDVIWSDSITDVVRDYAGNVISVENIIEFVIRDENGNDVTANYDFGDKGSREGRLVYGTLTINPVKLTVTVKKIEKTYDGIQIYSLTENKNYTVTEIEGRIVSGDRLYVYLETPFIDATDGWEKFAVFYEIYNDPDNYDVTVCYEDGRAYGYINIKPYEVNISISDITRTYNAQAVTISNKNYFIENFEEFDLFISQRHTYGISINNTFVNAGEYQWTVVFYADRGGIDATKNFKVTVTGTEGNNNGYAKLTINKRVLNYYCGGNTWEYDGEEHNEKYNILEIIENGNQGLLNEFHYFVPTGWTTITDVGEDLNVIAFLIYEENVDVTGNYDINLIREKCEKLIVTPRRIDVKSADATKTYDGTPLVANSATVTRSVDDEFALVEGHSIKVTEYIKDYSNVIRKKPTGEVDFIANEISFVILDAYGKDVTKNYTFEESEGGSYTSGTLKINPRKITIAARSGIWAYDGKIHTQGGYFITSGNLVGSHTVKDVFTISGQRRLVGKSDNVIIANVVNEIYKETVAYLEGIIQSGDGDVTYNYEISLENGTLEVTPLATLTITPDYVGGEYNGQAHVSTVGRHTAGDVLEGDGGVLFVLTKGSLTNAGTAISSVRIVVVEDEFGIGVWVNGKMNYYTYGVDDDPNAAMYVEADGLYLKISPDKNLKDDRVSIILKDEMPDDPNCHQGYTADDGETATESYYAIYGQEGEIEVFKREIVITCESKKQAYSDSIKSLSGGAYISYGELVSGHVLEYSSTAMATKDNPKVTNELYSYDIKAKDGKSVIDNYEVTVINGTLELTGV